MKGVTTVENLFVGTTIEEALAILSYRIKLTAGDIIELTDGTMAVVSANNIDEQVVSCIFPIVGGKYEYRRSIKSVPYSVIKAPVRGEYVSLDTLMKSEGLRIVYELVEDEKWQDAYEMTTQLEKAGMDVSKLVEVLKNSIS